MRYSFLITLLIACKTFSQSYKGTIEKVQENGLHKIMLPLNIRAASTDNFNFLRIKNNKQQEVPYVLLYATDKTFSEFVPVEIASKNSIKDSVTSILIENKNAKKQDNITLKIANTKIIKSYTVYGSDNKKDWFGLIANKRLSYANKMNTTVLEKTIYFPLNDYKFLRIDFNDKYSLPINILEAGVYKSKFFTQEAVEVSDFTQEIRTIKEKKITQLKFTAKDAHKIDVISFDIATDFFLRKAKVIVTRTRNIKKRVETYDQVLDYFELNSKNINTFNFGNLNVKQFIIEIENQDNPPLNIEKVQFFQKPVHLIANLKAQEAYEVVVDTNLVKPSYDLGNFISNTTENIKKAFITEFTKLEAKNEKTTEEKMFWETKTFMWACIVLGGFFVVYFALSLLKDIDSEK